MAGFSMVGTFVSGLAVLLVYDTLKETRRATTFAESSAAASINAAAQAQETNRIAERSSFLENRPWVEISSFDIDHINIIANPHPHIKTRFGMAVNGSYRLKNLGKSPATEVYSMQVYAIRDDIPSLNSRMEGGLKSLQARDPRFFQGILGPGGDDLVTFGWFVEVDEPPVMGAGYVKNDLRVAIAVLVVYRSNLEETIFHTAQAFTLRLEAGAGFYPFALDFEDLRENGRPPNLKVVRMADSKMT
ncbi:hypothetical protein [Sinorhizobium meliloti]|uniref:hypothetical protein n=1 Tax=Rhizobium meliloti TaxID=382 RepID=UPI000FDA2B63|nr:hypothetical protein [Sinorhizobium meliloti]RVK40908.1 hypothetical protein CN163_08430 [Sinorhizobium meliloti]